MRVCLPALLYTTSTALLPRAQRAARWRPPAHFKMHKGTGKVLAFAAAGAAVVSASWSHSQRDVSRDNSASSSLPTIETGVVAQSVLTGLTSLWPAYHSAKGVLVASSLCTVSIATPSLAAVVRWDACSGGVGNITGTALHEGGIDTLVVLSSHPSGDGRTQVTGLSATPANPGTLFGPHDLGMGAVAEPLVLGDVAYVLASNGTLLLADLVRGGSVHPAPQPVALCSPLDSVSQPLVVMQVPVAGGPGASQFSVLFAVTDGGCGSAFDSAGTRMWNMSFNLGVGDAVHQPPASDSSAGRGTALVLTAQGLVCCVSLTGGMCEHWKRRACVPVTSEAGQLPLSGLAVSPPTNDYHGGRAYTLGADGTLFGVGTGDGAVEESALPVVQPPVVSPPVLIPNGWGVHNNALLVVSSSAAAGGWPFVVAVSVGNNGNVDDDDAVDDDGEGNAGVVWTVNLPSECGSVLPLGGGLSVNDAGRVFLICPNSIVTIDPDHAPPLPVGSPEMEAAVVAGCVAAVALAIGGVGYAVYRRRVALRDSTTNPLASFMDAADGSARRGQGGAGLDADYIAVTDA